MAQVALNEQLIIEAQNAVDINYLNLKQLLELDPKEDLKIDRPAVTIPAYANPSAYSLNEIYTNALGTQPQIKAGDRRLESAILGESIMKASMLPSLVIFGSLNANYSSAFLDFENADFSEAELVPESFARPVLVGEQLVTVTEFEWVGITIPRKSWADQLSETFGQSIGLSLSVPIYNKHRNKVNLERARLNTLNQEVINQQARQQLKTDIQRAIADARAAQESLEASQISLQAAQAAFDNAQRKFDLGTINTLEYTTARNTLDRAQLDLIQAKYRYLFFVKTVEFYQGKVLTLD